VWLRHEAPNPQAEGPSNRKIKEIIMKTLVTVVALATLVATPVFAQTATKRAQAPKAQEAQQPYPQFRASNARHATNPAYDVYDTNGQYVGSDPDPTVRGMIQADHGSAD
jgi:flagellar basal body-associated protein FliL